MNAKAKGRKNEIKALELLQSEGYEVIIAPKSRKKTKSKNPAFTQHDFFGLWDIVAVDGNSVRFVQVKTNRKPYGEERKKYDLFRCPLSCSKEIWVFYDRKKEHEIIYL